MAGATPLLEIRGLRTSFTRRGEEIVAVDDLDLTICAGETVALVGESGSGKSVTGLSIMRLLARGIGRVAAGSIRLHGEAGAVDLTGLDEEAMRRVRGASIGMVFQEPMTSLNPVLTIGDQISEPLHVHDGLGHDAARTRVLAMLAAVGIPDPERRIGAYPHELSGGMRQRAMIAMALICRPRLLIADEPTTALDTTIQAQIVELLERLQRELGMAILFITHNLGLVADMAHRVAIMYAGCIVEHGRVEEIFTHPRHPYTRGLLGSVPRPGEARALRRSGGRLAAIPGQVPNLRALPPGCAFAPRCNLAAELCRAQPPAMTAIDPSRGARCHRWAEL
jgi:peptide/nickel transport system ATP-binding protein